MERLTTKAWPPPLVRNGFRSAAKLSRVTRFLDEGYSPLVEEMAILILGIDDREARFVEFEMTLDERQRAAPDRAKTDHDNRACNRAMHGPLRHWFFSRWSGECATVQRYKKEPQASSQRLLETSTLSKSPAGPDGTAQAARRNSIAPRYAGRSRAPAAITKPSRRFQRAAFEFEPEKARFIDGAGKRKPERMAAGKAEGFIISRVADEQDGFVPGARRTEQSLRHEPAANSARTISLGNGKRTKQKRWHLASQDMPHPQGANRDRPRPSPRARGLARASGPRAGARRSCRNARRRTPHRASVPVPRNRLAIRWR